ncbi:MAG TPA: hypothetical protein VFJ57_16755 [Solirubrobacterales bacterium]|nr:hypothetical protein [Solirubrobacterales bacterium]
MATAPSRTTPAPTPVDVVAEDGLALIEQVGLEKHDLGGYSLAARTTISLLARGATPDRAVIAGMGLAAIVHTADRGSSYRRVLANPGGFGPGTLEARADAYGRRWPRSRPRPWSSAAAPTPNSTRRRSSPRFSATPASPRSQATTPAPSPSPIWAL